MSRTASSVNGSHREDNLDASSVSSLGANSRDEANEGPAILTGYLWKRADSSFGWRKRWFSLTTHTLSYTNSPFSNDARSCFWLRDNFHSARIEQGDDPTQFKAFFPKGVPRNGLTLKAKCQAEADEWINAIVRATKESSPSRKNSKGPESSTPAVQHPYLHPLRAIEARAKSSSSAGLTACNSLATHDSSHNSEASKSFLEQHRDADVGGRNAPESHLLEWLQALQEPTGSIPVLDLNSRKSL